VRLLPAREDPSREGDLPDRQVVKAEL
jgi:hypothetical protein